MSKHLSESCNVPTRQTRPIRTVVVDDSPVALQAVVEQLVSHPAIEVVGSAWDGEEGQALVERLEPRLVVTDLDMPRRSGLQLVESLRQKFPTMRLVIISTHEGAVWKNLSATRGADAFVPKRQLELELNGLVERLFPEVAP